MGGTGDYVEVAGKKLFYTDTTSAPIQALTTLAGEQQFVYVDTAGNAEDFAAVKDILTGKIAICNRGSIAFTDKGNNAISNGAIALIVANNEAGTISMATMAITTRPPMSPYCRPTASTSRPAPRSTPPIPVLCTTPAP